jgi:hypothetical protein
LFFLRDPISLDGVDFDIPSHIDAAAAPAARKRHAAPPRNSKEAERAAKKSRLDAAKRTAASMTASDASRSAADQGVVGSEGTQPADPVAPSPPRTSDPVTAPATTISSPIMTTTSPIMATGPSSSPPPTSPHPASPAPQPEADTFIPLVTSAPPSSEVAPSSSLQTQPPKPTSESVVLMRSVDQFRAEYSRTGQASKEPDASGRFLLTSQDPMSMALSRTRDFAVAMAQDLQQIDRDHTVRFCLFRFSFLIPPLGKAFLQWVRESPRFGPIVCNRLGSFMP